MRRIAVLVGLAAVTVLSAGLAGCEKMMENAIDYGHRPSISNFQILTEVTRPESEVRFTVSYVDEGADITAMYLRDDNSGNSYALTITTDEDGNLYNPFSGAAGTVNGVIESFIGHQAGPHTVSIYAQDLEGATSERLEDTVILSLQ